MKKYALVASIMVLSIFMLSSCRQRSEERLRIALNAWPGYEFVFVAEELGFFDKVGLPVELVETTSLQDSLQRVLVGGADAMGCTMIEALLAADVAGLELSALAYFDYSNGADVLLSHKELASVQDLRGKRVGVERASLGIIILHRALEKYGMSFSDVDIVFTDQADMEVQFGSDLDAVVSYPPVSTRIMRSKDSRVVFSTSEIPYEILDLVVVNRAFEARHPDLYDKFQRVWKMVYAYWKEHPDEANTIMAGRLGITVEELELEFKSIAMMSPEEQVSAEVSEMIHKSAEASDTVLRSMNLLQNEPEYASIVRKR